MAITNTNNRVVVNGTNGNDNILNSMGLWTTIYAGDDSVRISGVIGADDSVIAFGGTGNDTLQSSYAEKVTMYGEEGNDVINVESMALLQ